MSRGLLLFRTQCNYHVVVADGREVKGRPIVVDVSDVDHRVTRRPEPTATGNSISRVQAGPHRGPDGNLIDGALFSIQPLRCCYGAGHGVQPERRRFSTSGFGSGATGSGIKIADAGVGELVERVQVAVYRRHVSDAGARRLILVHHEAVDRKRKNRKLIVDVGDGEVNSGATCARRVMAAVRRHHVEDDPRHCLSVKPGFCRDHSGLGVDPDDLFHFRFRCGGLETVRDLAVKPGIAVDRTDLQQAGAYGAVLGNRQIVHRMFKNGGVVVAVNDDHLDGRGRCQYRLRVGRTIVTNYAEPVPLGDFAIKTSQRHHSE